MKPICKILTVPLIIALVPVIAHAEKLEEGNIELGISGSHMGASLSFEGEEVTTGSLTTFASEVGYFLSPCIEIAGGVDFSRDSNKIGGLEETSSHYVSLTGSLVFNIPMEGPTIPFVTLGGGFVVYGGDSFGDDTSYLFPSITVGVRLFASSNVSINFEFGYQHHKNIGGWDGLNRSSFIAGIGISAFFRGD
ncbi:MAG: outer membrane beta-barrel protein [Candidatus Krumholzibacteriota bacterium]|nr:outer membrane beta-barrel protein [Candidatus Krumholzibacteriota bacterium]